MSAETKTDRDDTTLAVILAKAGVNWRSIEPAADAILASDWLKDVRAMARLLYAMEHHANDAEVWWEGHRDVCTDCNCPPPSCPYAETSAE